MLRMRQRRFPGKKTTVDAKTWGSRDFTVSAVLELGEGTVRHFNRDRHFVLASITLNKELVAFHPLVRFSLIDVRCVWPVPKHHYDGVAVAAFADLLEK